MIHTDGRPTIANAQALADVQVRNEGSLFLVQPLTAKGKDWLRDHIDDDAQTWGQSIVVEHRYIVDVVDGMHDDGLKVI